MLQILDLVDHLAGLLAAWIEAQAHILGFRQDIALSGQLGDQHPLLIAHKLGCDMLVSSGIAQDCRYMDAAFVRKCGIAYIRLIDRQVHIGHFADIMGCIC
ncbi:hypothetical protein D3C76_667590 [compost metagenome]